MVNGGLQLLAGGGGGAADGVAAAIGFTTVVGLLACLVGAAVTDGVGSATTFSSVGLGAATSSVGFDFGLDLAVCGSSVTVGSPRVASKSPPPAAPAIKSSARINTA